MKKQILIAAACILLLAACTSQAEKAPSGYCPTEFAEDNIQTFDFLAEKYADLDDLAAATGRGSLSPIVLELLKLKWEVMSVNTAECLTFAQEYLASSIDYSANGYLEFMMENDDGVTSNFASALNGMQGYFSEVEKTNECLPDCKE